MMAKPQKPAQKPALGTDVIQSAMERRPRLNANARRAAPGVAAKPPAPAQPPKPAWQQLRDAGIAGTGSAAGNRAAAAALPTAAGVAGRAATAPPPQGAMSAPGAAPPAPGDMGGPGSDIGFQPGEPFMSEPMPIARPEPPAMATFPAPSGSQNPQFSANLPPEIMQRLVALQGMRAGGGQGAPGVASVAPGAPAVAPPPTLPDYYQPPPGVARGVRQTQPSFDRRVAY